LLHPLWDVMMMWHFWLRWLGVSWGARHGRLSHFFLFLQYEINPNGEQ
jgi:hypothetical protein